MADLVGSWRLVSHEEHKADGTVVPLWGTSVGGRLTYDADGRMAVQVMNPARRSFAVADSLAGTTDEVREAFEGYIAYYGSYAVDAEHGVITHHVEGSLYPNFIGTHLRRAFQLSGRRLRLETPPMVVGGRTSTYVLTWEREG